MKLIKLKAESGFTMIELVLVVAIGVILATVGVINIQKFRNSKDVEFSLNELAAAVEETRTRSVAQESGERWSIRFISTSTGTDAYEIYTGAVYASSNVVSYRSLRRSVEFGEPSGDRTIDLNFEPVTGRLANKKVITLVSSKGVRRIGDVIVDIFGRVTKRIEDDVVGYWHFDEGTGISTLDASGNGVYGTLQNSPLWQATSSCRAGRCLSFDGIDDYVSTGSLFSYADSVTVSAWVYHNASADWDDIVAGGCGDLLFGFSINNLSFGGRCNNPFTPISYTTNINSAWHHVAGVYDGSLASLYVDGVRVASSTKSGSFSAFIPNIGGLAGAENFDGRIDEVRIWSRALTADEVKARYNDLR